MEFVMININECLDENVCIKKSCSNKLLIENEPAVIFTNKTSFVGVKAIVAPSCDDTDIELTECYNGGTYTGGITPCICPEGFEGPYCEILGIGFKGDGYALYRNFEAFEITNINLQVSAEKENGLIFYIGPQNVIPEPPVRGNFKIP